jgi:hypothetical protein
MTQYGCMFLIQILCHRTQVEAGVHVEQEHRSFDRRHFLEYGIQNGDPGRQGYANYINYAYYMHYFNYINYLYVSKWMPIPIRECILYQLYALYQLY